MVLDKLKEVVNRSSTPSGTTSPSNAPADQSAGGLRPPSIETTTSKDSPSGGPLTVSPESTPSQADMHQMATDKRLKPLVDRHGNPETLSTNPEYAIENDNKVQPGDRFGLSPRAIKKKIPSLLRSSKKKTDKHESADTEEAHQDAIEKGADSKGGLTSFGFGSGSGSASSQDGTGYSSASVFGLLKALAKGSDEPLKDDEDEDDEDDSRSITSLSSTQLSRRDDDVDQPKRYDAANGDGMARGDMGAHQPTTGSEAQGKDAEANKERSTSGTATGTRRPSRAQRQPSYGEWIDPVQVDASGMVSTESGSKKTIIPAFYRQPSMNQDELSRRLALLSVSNYSDLAAAVGETNRIKYPRRKTETGPPPKSGRAPTARRRATTSSSSFSSESALPSTGAGEREKASMKPSLHSTHEEDSGHTHQLDRPTELTEEGIEDKKQEIQHSLRHESADEIRARLAPGLVDGEHRTDPTSGTEDHDNQPRSSDEVTRVAENDDLFDDFKISDEDKLAAIKEEFGDWSSLMFPDQSPEKYVDECRGALFRGILILGNIHLTTHRVTFHAMLPPPRSDDPDGLATILHSGPITLHRNHLLGPRTQRVWMELSADMLTTYPSATEEGRVKPLRSILLSAVKQLYPMDSERPFEIRFKFAVPHGEETMVYTVDTQESALHWHRDLESALFQNGRTRRYQQRLAQRAKELDGRPNAPSMSDDPVLQEDDGGWEMLRMCLPLDRVREVGTEDYLDFARLISLDVDVVVDKNGSPSSALMCHQMDLLLPINPYPMQSPANHHPYACSQEPTESHAVKRTSTFRSYFGMNSEKSHSGKSPKLFARSSSTFSQSHIETRHIPSPLGSPQLSPAAADGPHSEDGGVTRNGAFRGPTADPEDLTSNASILPVVGDSVTNGGTGKTVNIKFGILSEREEFARKFHETVNMVSSQGQRFKPGVDRPIPVVMMGDTTLLELSEVEGGAGLASSDQKKRARRHGLRKSGETSQTDGDDPSNSSDSDDDIGNPGGLRKATKLEKIAKAKAIFGIPENEHVWMKRCYLQKTVPFRGHIILGHRYICFWRKVVGFVHDIKYRFPSHDLKGAKVVGSYPLKLQYGLVVQIAGHPDLHFEFFSRKARDETLSRINSLAHERESPDTPPQPRAEEKDPTADEREAVAAVTTQDEPGMSYAEEAKLNEKRQQTFGLLGAESTRTMDLKIPDEAFSHVPNVINLPRLVDSRKKVKPRRFALLTIGSRGDIQPYIALALGLMKDGHKVAIVTHDEFKEWIEGYGIEHRQAGGDPAALMKLSVEHKMFSPGFFKESLGHFRDWLDSHADVLIESPSAMSGIHIAEALRIPYFRAFTMPWTRTADYPQAFMVPAVEMGPGFNYSTYVIFDNIMWKATSGQVNRWRKKHLKLRPTDMSKLSQTKVPFMYNFSSAICPKPLDWHDDIVITGYWYLEDSDSDWSPPKDLEEFMEKAKRDERPLVYIGFGSIVVPHPNEMTRSIIKAVDKANVRAIIAKGWSSRGSGDESKEGDEPIKFSDNCYSLDKVPHGWLFPKIDVALHHGGAGTVGASLRAGIPTLIKPWFGDQMFWAARVTKLGVGMKVSDLDSDHLAAALETATTDRVMRERASKIGERIRAYIYANLLRASKDRTKLQWQKQ